MKLIRGWLTVPVSVKNYHEVIAGVLQSDEEQELSDFEESESEIGDSEDEEGNQQLLVTSQIPINFVHPVDRETLLDDDDDDDDDDDNDDKSSKRHICHSLFYFIAFQ